MSNKLDDFFDQEYQSQQGNGDSFSHDNVFSTATNYTAPPAKNNKKITVLLICIALVLAIVFGVFAGILIGSGSEEDNILSSVLDTLRNDYYFDISDEEWETIIANGGTALLQGVDDYGQLLSPQSAYDLLNGVSTVTTVDGLSYGFSYYNVGSTGVMVVSSVTNDTNAFGRLESGDIVLALSDIKSATGGGVLDSDGNVITSLSLASVDSSYTTAVLTVSNSATFVVLRGDDVMNISVTKGTIGSINNTEGLQFVQYYFGAKNTNVSTTIEPGRATSTMVYKCLDQLPSNVGYISLSQFSSSTTSDASTEFQLAMSKFQASGMDYLIVDVKGNPGGDVQIATDIAGMLATDSLLDSSVLSQYNMSSDADMLVVTMQDNSGSTTSTYTVTSTYSQYFDTTSDTKQIIIWTDSNSASASELLTGVLLDYGTGVQMGTTTYGKGIAQTIVPLYEFSDTVTQIDGTEGTFYWCLYYTFAKYYSPFGNNIHGVGYTPDDSYNNLDSYSELVDAVNSYWN